MVSTTMAYGAYPANPNFLTETAEVLVGSQALPLMDGAVALEPAA